MKEQNKRMNDIKRIINKYNNRKQFEQHTFVGERKKKKKRELRNKTYRFIYIFKPHL